MHECIGVSEKRRRRRSGTMAVHIPERASRRIDRLITCRERRTRKAIERERVDEVPWSTSKPSQS